ncbi:hypothetical protein [Opitutus sp. ER46]|uniref:hypothetical protein n=1 Tax=Opitutus sp. ER46 TaxID=2161864 RepID=UPI000D2FCA98|nr:hypothetical protein [Opitutus sp. ER46]PTX92532.1 hypothetical protein DB354_14475 [Opitutus sp. ER46]
MVTSDTLGDRVQRWAEGERRVAALVLIGSRARATPDPRLAADKYSDWDYHLITSAPEMLRTPDWMAAAGLPAPTVYVLRLGRLGAATKVTTVVAGTLMDLVVIPTGRIRLLRWAWRLGYAARNPRLWETLQGLAVVLAAGHRVVKGGAEWVNFYAQLAREVPPPRLDDAAVRRLADGFYCDYLSTRQKIARGELIAAQRWLHHTLADVLFQLLHERRLRQREVSMPDARRMERLADADTLAAARIEARLDARELTAAVDTAAQALTRVTRDLLGPAWQWPEDRVFEAGDVRREGADVRAAPSCGASSGGKAASEAS